MALGGTGTKAGWKTLALRPELARTVLVGTDARWAANTVCETGEGKLSGRGRPAEIDGRLWVER